jgi:chromate transporter
VSAPPGERSNTPAEVLRVALQLGLTSFGGPVAHLGYFERTYVRERAWLRSEDFAALVALCQVLPGPTSSQVGFLVGLQRAGWRGALAAWVGFTLPSALLLYGCARLAAHAQGPLALAAVHGLQLVAVAVVAQALVSMARRLCPDRRTQLLALAACLALLLFPAGVAQLAVLAAAAAAGGLWCRPGAAAPLAAALRPRAAHAALAALLLLLASLPLLAWRSPHGYPALAWVFARAGALVFGGGHVVLPLLQGALVPQGWLSDEAFLTGYGLAQAVPGPLFTVAAYLGALTPLPSPALAATVAVIAIFLPGLLLAVSGAALFALLLRHPAARAALTGVNAGVVGILAAAWWNPICTTAIHVPLDAVIAAAALALLQWLNAAPVLIVLGCLAVSLARVLL